MQTNIVHKEKLNKQDEFAVIPFKLNIIVWRIMQVDSPLDWGRSIRDKEQNALLYNLSGAMESNKMRIQGVG